MTTIDGDWVCDEEDLDDPKCFAVWEDCPDCDGGFVKIGKGMEPQYGNLHYDDREELAMSGREICITCTGSGGGYVCGFHDLGMTAK